VEAFAFYLRSAAAGPIFEPMWIRRFKAHELVAPGEKDETVLFECTKP
jgi:hypothetical protein